MAAARPANPRAVRFPAGAVTVARIARQAWAPSRHAPRAADVLDPARTAPPTPPRLPADERRLLDAVLLDPDADEPRRAYHSRVRAAGASDHSAFFRSCGATDLVVRRGFVEGMSLSGRAFISLGGAITRLTPLREVTLVAVQPFVGELARCPHLAGIRRLDLTGNHIGPDGVQELAGSPFLGGLRELVLSGNALGSDGIAQLTAAPWLARLTSLAIADNGVTANDLWGLLSRSPNLVVLDVSGNPLGEVGAGALAGSEVAARLQRLSAARCGLGPAGAAALFAGRLPALTELDVRHNALGPAGASTLARDESLTHLARLDLGFNDVESAGAEAVARANSFRSLRVLNLSANRITEPGGRALAASEFLDSVEELDLSVNPLGDRGAVAVVRGEAFASLSRLSVANVEITDDGVGGLVASGGLGGLRSLSVAWNRIGDVGVSHLAACPDLAGLRELDLTGTAVGAAGADALTASRHLVNLRRVVLGENPRLPAEAAALLAARFGTITADDLNSGG